MNHVLKMSLLFSLLLLVQPAYATSWVYSFIVWDGNVYIMTEEKIEDVGKKIGKVTSYSDMDTLRGNFSNRYPVGTKYFEIENVNIKEAIAVEVEQDHYLKATYSHPYEGGKRSLFESALWILSIMGVLVIGIIIYNQIVKK